MAWLARNNNEDLNIFDRKPNINEEGMWRTNEYIAFNVYDDNFGGWNKVYEVEMTSDGDVVIM